MRLITVFLDDVPNYEALSYAWGDQNIKDSILLDGQDFLITASLKAALWHLRLITRVRKIWIDAICINQADTLERSQQVLIMRDIYANADKVIVWLGEESENSGIAMHILEDMSSGFVDYKTFGYEPSRCKAEEVQMEVELWQPVTELFHRPFWSRVWIVQEIALAKEALVCCGWRSIQWATLETALYRLLHSNRVDYEPFKTEVYHRVFSLRLEREDFKHPRVRVHFSDLLYRQRFRKLSEQRDIIYSIIGIAKDIFPGTIVPDYSQPAQRVYQNATRSVILDTGRLDMLSHVLLQFNISEFPSWVRDWEKPSAVIPFFKGLAGENFYQASRNSRVIAKSSEDLDIFTLQGFQYDNIVQIFEFVEVDIWRGLHSWKEMARLDQEQLRPYISGGDLFNAFWRSLVANQALEHDEEHEVVKAPEKEQMIAERLLGLRPCSEDVVGEEDLLSFVRRMRPKIKYRRMILTRMGYLGLAPPETEKEDLVCVLLGGDMPFVLRPKGSWHTFVGECYVHGIMDGEVLDAAQAGLVQLQEFSLR